MSKKRNKKKKKQITPLEEMVIKATDYIERCNNKR